MAALCLYLVAATACSDREVGERPATRAPAPAADGERPARTAPRDGERPGRAATRVPAVTTRTGFRVPSAVDRQRAVGAPAMSAAVDRAVGVHDSFEPMDAPQPGDWLAEHPEPGQTFDRFVASRPNRPAPDRRTIYFLPIGRFDPDLGPPVEILARFARTYYGLPVRVLPPVSVAELDAEQRAGPGTGKPQLLTGDILAFARKRLPADAYCLILLTQVDLYPDPDWNFVFGQASLRERVGVYSFARYHPSFHGEAAAPDETRALVLRRSLKVMVHELGHMFGIEHCVFFQCVLAGSNSLEETDRRPLHLCPVELRKLIWSVGIDPLARYQALAALYRRHGLADEAAWVAGRIAEISADGE